MNIEDYKYLWDGSQPGWALHYTDHVVWHLIFNFGYNGPGKKTIVKLHGFVPEFQNEKLPFVYKKVKGKSKYRTERYYEHIIEAKELERKAYDVGLNIELEPCQIGGYLPMYNRNIALAIDDDEMAKEIEKKMLEAGVKVIEEHDDSDVKLPRPVFDPDRFYRTEENSYRLVP